MRGAPADDGVCQTPRVIIDVDNPLAYGGSIREGDVSRIAIELRIDHEVLCQSRMHVTDVTERGPHVICRRVHAEFLVNRGHTLSALKALDQLDLPGVVHRMA